MNAGKYRADREDMAVQIAARLVQKPDQPVELNDDELRFFRPSNHVTMMMFSLRERVQERLSESFLKQFALKMKSTRSKRGKLRSLTIWLEVKE